MNKIKKNLFVVIAIIILLISGFLYLYLANKEQEDIKTGFVQGKIAYDSIDNYVDGIMLAKKNNNYLIIDINDKIIEKIDEEATDIKILYGGYYSYTLGEKVYLNRKGKNIKTFDTLFLEDFSLYKDENDENSAYITLNANQLLKDIYYVIISNDDNIKTIIYNSKTGKKLYETDNYISLLETPNMKEYEYFVVGDKELVRISDFKTIFKETDINISGDNTRADVLENIKTNSSKYIVISSKTDEDSQKFGLIDFEGNIIIPLTYEDIVFKTDNNRYIAVKKEDKYGLINGLNEELLDFSYDVLEVYDNNILAIKNNQLGIMDNDLNLIYNYKLSISDKEYNSRICCGNKNAFETFIDDNNLIISTFPKNDEENDGLTFSNTLLVNKKNEVKELKKQTIKYIIDDKEVIKNKYLIKELIDEQTLTLKIYDTSGKELATYETLTQDSINSVSYELINENYLLIIIYDKDYKVLYQAVIETDTGKVLVENEEIKNYIKKQNLIDGYYYYGKDNSITIKDSNDRIIMSIDGKDIIYLQGSYYALKNKDNKYYICKVLLKEEQVK